MKENIEFMELEGGKPTKQIVTTNGNHKPKMRSWDVNQGPHIYLEGYTHLQGSACAHATGCNMALNSHF